MRALLLNSLRGQGGGEEWFASAVRLLVERGHHAILGARTGSALAAIGRERGLPLVELPLGGDFDPRSVAALHRVLGDERIEVVVTNLDKELRVAALAAFGLPLIALVPRRGSVIPVKDHAFNRWLYRRRVTRILVNSSAIRDGLRDSLPGLPASRIALLPNGADPVTLADAEREALSQRWPAGDGPRLITVGEVSRRKNQVGIVHALARVKGTWRLLVVGGGEALPELRGEVARLGLEDRVAIAGYVPEARRLTACADVFVHFSSVEGQPWAVLEALAQGIPTVATRLPGVTGAIVDGETGRLVAPGDEAGLAMAIERLLGDPAGARALGEAARAHIAATHSSALLGDRLESLLEAARLTGRTRAPLGRRAVFLDRDGTLVPEAGALGDPDRVRLLPGVGAALRLIEQAGYAPVVVTNQAAIGRGLVTAPQVRAVHARLRRLVREEGVELAGIYVCPHRPEDACACRKPAPGLVLNAAASLGLTLPGSWLVGDTVKDVQAAQRAGVRPALLASGWGGDERVTAKGHAAKDAGGHEEAPGETLRAPDLLAFAERLASGT